MGMSSSMLMTQQIKNNTCSSYYNFQNNLLDSVWSNNLTWYGSFDANGKILQGFNMSLLWWFINTDSFTVNIWCINFINFAFMMNWHFQTYDSTTLYYRDFRIYSTGANIACTCTTGLPWSATARTATLWTLDHVYHMYSFVSNGSIVKMYFDWVLKLERDDNYDISMYNINAWYMEYINWDQRLDEISVFADIFFTDEEVLAYYNTF